MKSKHQTFEDLKLLFEFVPPEKLKSTITSLLLQSLISGETPDKETCQDIYLFFDFLDKQKKQG